jgi:hypothetical protein
MGEGYKARDTRLDSAVAFKVLAPAYAADAERNLRFAVPDWAASLLR